MNVLPPQLTTPFPSIHINYYFPLHRRHHAFQPPLSAANSVTAFSPSSPLIVSEGPDDILALQNRRYDFTPLLRFLSRAADDSESNSDSASSPASLDSTEFQLAESYRAVPAPLWHALLKSLCSSSPSSIGLAYGVVLWLQKHSLCFSYELLYSILIHALGRSEKLYEAFLLSQRQVLTPFTYNALIGACARNGDLEKALNLMSRMRGDGFQPDFVNYSSIILSLTRSNRIDSPILQKLCGEIESDKIEVDAHLLNDIILGFSKAGDATRY